MLTACDSTVWGGTTYTTSGMYNDTLVSAAGCDSIITLDLTIVSPVTNNVDSTICLWRQCVVSRKLPDGKWNI